MSGGSGRLDPKRIYRRVARQWHQNKVDTESSSPVGRSRRAECVQPAVTNLITYDGIHDAKDEYTPALYAGDRRR